MKRGDTSNLNLLPSQAKFQAAKIKLKKTLYYYMSVAGVLWLAVVIILIVLYFGSDYILSLQNKKYEQAFNSLQSLSTNIVTSQLLKYRTKVLGEVLDDRFEYSTAFNKINSLFKEEIRVVNFELEDKSKFLVTVETSGKDNVNNIEDKVTEINLGKVDGFDKAVIDNANKTGDDWLLQLELYLK